MGLTCRKKFVSIFLQCAFFSQLDKDEVPKCPQNPTESLKSGYKTLSNNIPDFFQINEMHMPIEVRHINNGDGNDNTLIKHHAKYHEACRLIFNNTKLKRVQKRRCPSEKRSADQSTSSKLTRKTTSVAAKEVEPELVQCFIREKFVCRSEIREAMTMQLNDRLNQCTHNLQDEKRLAKLSIEDTVAQALKYHADCLTALYNRERSALKKNRQTMMIHL